MKQTFLLSVFVGILLLFVVGMVENSTVQHHAHAMHTTLPHQSVQAHHTTSQIITPTQLHTTALLSTTRALQWLATQQNNDGGFTGFTPQVSDMGTTLDVLLAFGAAHDAAQVPLPTQQNGTSILDYIAANAASYANTNAASAGKLAVGIAAVGQDPADVHGVNLVISMTNYYSPTTGAYGVSSWDHMYAMLGMAAAGEPVPRKAVDYLKHLQTAEGNWTYYGSEVDSTGLALQALAAAGEPRHSTVVSNALAFLAQQQHGNGGFANMPNAWAPHPQSNANATALALQGMIAIGEDPTTAQWTQQPTGTTPLGFLWGLQQPNSSFASAIGTPDSSTFSTRQVIPALVGVPFPIASQQVAQRNGFRFIASQQDADGHFAGFGVGSTIDAVFALAASPQTPSPLHFNYPVYTLSALDYLAANTRTYAANGASAVGKLMAGVVVAGGNPRDIATTNLVISMTKYYSPTTGAYGAGDVWSQSWALLGMAAAGEPVPPRAIVQLQEQQRPNGCWGKDSVDSTGLALQALIANGVAPHNERIIRGLEYLRISRQSDNGWGWSSNTTAGTNASSTAMALLGMAAANQNPRTLSWSNMHPSMLMLRSPFDTLLALQTTLGGFPGYAGNNDPDATYQAMQGVNGMPLPPMPIQFVVSQTAGIVPLTVAFTNTSHSCHNDDHVVWHFGDNTHSTTIQPTHTYTTPGSYTVTLMCNNTLALTRPQYIQAYAPPVTPIKDNTPPLDLATRPTVQAAYRALQWLRQQQQSDGSYAGFGGNVTSTIDSVLAAAAAHQSLTGWVSNRSNSMIEYVRSTLTEATNAASVCKVVVGIAAGGDDPHAFRSVNLMDAVATHYDAASGAYGTNNWDQSWCLLAMAAAGETIPDAAVTLLTSRITPDGYWAYGPSDTTNFAYVDTTGLVLQALNAARVPITTTTVQRAISYLHNIQDDDGGFPDIPAFGGPQPDYGNANTTAMVVQGLIAMGENPLSAAWQPQSTSITSTNPISFLLRLQQQTGNDTGKIWWSHNQASGIMATQQTIPALLGKHHPLRSRAVILNNGVKWAATQQQANGSFGNQVGITLDACIGLAAAHALNSSTVNTTTLVQYLHTQAATYTTSAAATGKLMTCAVTLGENVSQFGTENLIDTLATFFNADSNSYGTTTLDHAWAIIGLRAAGETVSTAVFDALHAMQMADGGWGWSSFAASADTDTTALAVQALATQTPTLTANTSNITTTNDAIQQGMIYLRGTQNSDGGWGYSSDYPTTSGTSTAAAMQALYATGQDPASIAWSTANALDSLDVNTPFDALATMQSDEGGFAGYSGSNDAMTTYQAMPALNEAYLPLQTSVAAPHATVSITPTSGVAPLEVTFDNTSTGNVSQSEWVFGDGTTSALRNPTHIYTQAGNYTVTLTVQGDGGADTTTVAQAVTVNTMMYLPIVIR